MTSLGTTWIAIGVSIRGVEVFVPDVAVCVVYWASSVSLTVIVGSCVWARESSATTRVESARAAASSPD